MSKVELYRDVKNSLGYHKMLHVLEILKPGTRDEFEKYNDKVRKCTVH